MNILLEKKILLIICGGISAYKSLELIRSLKKKGAIVKTILTKSAEEFITPLSVASLSQDKVYKESLSRYGNTSAASVLIALHDFLKSTQIQVGDCLLLITFGGGLTYGAAVLTKN